MSGISATCAGLATDGLNQKVALAVDGAEAPLLDLEQLIGDARGLRAVAEVGREHAQFLPLGQFRIVQNRLLTWLQEKKLGWTIWLESPHSRK